MVEALINNVRAAEQTVSAYYRKLQHNYVGNPEAPLWMACLAAFPVAMTIDLMYQLWANFRELNDWKGKIYQLPPLVVNDCILSSLFRSTGRDIFEMSPDVRAYLLNGLRQKFGDELFADLASFLYKYIREKRMTDLPENFYDAQEWAALLTVDPKQAATDILSSLKSKLDTEDKMESIGVANLLTTLVKDNQDLAEIMRQALDKKTDNAAIQTETSAAAGKKNIAIRPGIAGSGMSIDIPPELSASLMPLYEIGVTETFAGASGNTTQGTVYAVMVAMGNGPTSSRQFQTFINLLSNKNLLDRQNIRILEGAEASYNQVRDAFELALSRATINDTVLFYFTGLATDEYGETHLWMADTRRTRDKNEDDPSLEGINFSFTEDKFKDILIRFSRNPATVITILDAKVTDADAWWKSDSRHVVIATGVPGDIKNSDQRSLTGMLVQLFDANRQHLTYKEIFRHLLLVEEQLPGFAIHREILDNYFLTTVQQSPILQNQLLLSKLGHRLLLDGKEGRHYQKAFDEFKAKNTIAEGSNGQRELQQAVLLRDSDHIHFLYFTVQPAHQNEAAASRNKIEEAITERLKIKGERDTLTFASTTQLNERVKQLVDANIVPCHVILIGINRHWINKPTERKELESFLNIAYVLNKPVYFVVEERLDFKNFGFNSYKVLPHSAKPVNTDQGMGDLLEDLDVIIQNLERYLGRSVDLSNNIRVEAILREARKTKMLALPRLSLREIPAAVFQIEGLISLDLGLNDITSVPPEIGQLQSLRTLILFENPISYLPKEIGNLLHLEHLDLRRTRLPLLPWQVGRLTNLKRLEIDDTPIKILNVGSFADRFPDVLSYRGVALLNAEHDIPLKQQFARVHSIEIAILEIHSEYSTTRLNVAPDGLEDEVYSRFFSGVNTLRQLFKLIYTQSGTKQTIVYLCDEKNILLPQFGNTEDVGYLICQYLDAFGRPLNLIINNPLWYSPYMPDLINKSKLNFVAIRNNTIVQGDGFAKLFFENIWKTTVGDQTYNIFVAMDSFDRKSDHAYLQRGLSKFGYEVWSAPESLASDSDMQPIRDAIDRADLVILIVTDLGAPRFPVFGNGRSYLEKQYKLTIEAKKNLFVFIQDAPFEKEEQPFKSFLSRLRRQSSVTRFSNVADLLKRIPDSIAGGAIPAQRRRMSIADTIKQLHTPLRGREPGYSVFVNYEVIKDFSLPLPSRSTKIKATSTSLITENEIRPVNSDRNVEVQTTTIKPFKNKWVLVAGTGYDSKISPAESHGCAAIGAMLAKEGYGVICGGWDGVDKRICEAYDRVLLASNQPVGDKIIQIVTNYQEPVFKKGTIQQVKSGDWNKNAFRNAFALIVIGGASLTKKSYEVAIAQNLPVIPISATKKVAADIFQRISQQSEYLYPNSLLRRLDKPLNSPSDAERIAFTVRSILQELSDQTSAAESFDAKVQALYKSRPIIFHSDVQKGRWGGKSSLNGKRLAAKVKRTAVKVYYDILFSVKGKEMDGKVAFFVHDSYPKQIIYATTKNKEATMTLRARKAFTVGAFVENGETMLELDLNNVTGYPDEFYSSIRRKAVDKDKKESSKTADKTKPKRKEEKRPGSTSLPAKKPVAKKKAAKSALADFTAPLTPSPVLAEIVGEKPITRIEIIKRLWNYVKKYKLQDTKNKRMINSDTKLKPLFGGKSQVSMFDLAKIVSKHAKKEIWLK